MGRALEEQPVLSELPAQRAVAAKKARPSGTWRQAGVAAEPGQPVVVEVEVLWRLVAGAEVALAEEQPEAVAAVASRRQELGTLLHALAPAPALAQVQVPSDR